MNNVNFITYIFRIAAFHYDCKWGLYRFSKIDSEILKAGINGCRKKRLDNGTFFLATAIKEAMQFRNLDRSGQCPLNLHNLSIEITYY